MPILTDKTELTTPALDDWMHVVDVSDTTSNPAGTSKRSTIQNIITNTLVNAVGATTISSFSPVSSDKILFQDVSDSGNLKQSTISTFLTSGFDASFSTVTFSNLNNVNPVAGSNYIQFQAANVGASIAHRLINFRTGGSPGSNAAIAFSSFSTAHYFVSSDTDSIFKIKYSNQNSDTPDLSAASTLFHLDAISNTWGITRSGSGLVGTQSARFSRLVIRGEDTASGTGSQVSVLNIQGSNGRNAGIITSDLDGTVRWLIGREYAGGGANNKLEIWYQGTRYFYIEDADGEVNVTNNLVVGGDITANNIATGTWTPTTITSSGPISSITHFQSSYQRVGNKVHIVGRINVQSSATSGTISVTATIPISSNFTSTDQLYGAVCDVNPFIYPSCNAYLLDADTVNDGIRLTIIKNTATANAYQAYYSVMYTIA